MANNNDNGPAKEKKPINFILILQILFAVINLGVMGTGAYLTYISTIAWKAPSISEDELASLKKEKEDDYEKISGPLLYTLDKFTVNLEGEPKRTLRVEINLEMLGKEGFEEVMDNDNRAKARDKIIQILNEKNFKELEAIQGKLFLKERIAYEINNILNRGVIKDIYFTEFVVQ